MRVHVAAAALALVLSASPGASARDTVAGAALFRAGREAAAKGDHATACARFEESQRLDPAPGTLLNLGDCKQHLGLYASAWAHYREAADHLAGDPRLDLARRRIDEITPRLSRLRIDLAPGAPPDTSVRRDGTELGAAGLGVPLLIDRGKHTLTVSARGREPREITVDVEVGQEQSVAVEPGPPLPDGPSPAAPTGEGPRAAGRDGLRIAGFVTGGLGLAGIAAGAATGIMTIQRKGTVEADCPNKACNPAGLQAASEGRALSTASTVSFAAGLAALGVGVALVAVGSRHRTAAILRNARERSATLIPSAAPGHAGLTLAGSF